MHLGLRLLFGVFLILGVATFFVFRVFVNEIKPSVRDVLEEVMVDSANAFAELAAPELATGSIENGAFAAAMRSYSQRNPQALISGLSKKSVDFRVYVTDASGIVRFDSENLAVGQNYSRWRDVLRTLRGEYGARVSRDTDREDGTSVFYVAAPVIHQGQRIGVLTLAKNSSTVIPIIERSEKKVLRGGAWLLGLSLLIGIAVTLWIVSSVRKLAQYAERVESGQRTLPPNFPGELGKLALAMNSMRERLEGKRYVENTVRALTHEIKSPIAAIRGAGELLREPLADADRERFANTVVHQTERMQRTVDRLLELSKLDALGAPPARVKADVVSIVRQVVAAAMAMQSKCQIELRGEPTAECACDAGLIQMSISNLIENAVEFSSEDALIVCEVRKENALISVDVTDPGVGFAEFAAESIGERFVSSSRPDGSPKSSGLGLAIAKQIAELHGGALTLESKGNPTRVRITLAQ